jgi:hypothetical protein
MTTQGPDRAGRGLGRLDAAIGESARAMSLTRPVIVQTVPVGCIKLEGQLGIAARRGHRGRSDPTGTLVHTVSGPARHHCGWHRHRPQAAIPRTSEGAAP